MLLPTPCPTCGTTLDDCRTAHGSSGAALPCEHAFPLDSLQYFTALKEKDVAPVPDAARCLRCGIAYSELKATG